jgi:hypothetical protein
VVPTLKILLRIISVWTGLSALVSLILLMHLLTSARLPQARTVVLVVGLVASAGLGVVAAVQLWRLRHSGRYIGAALSLFLASLSIVTVMQGVSLSSGDAVRLTLSLLTAIILLSPAAKHACRDQAEVT